MWGGEGKWGAIRRRRNIWSIAKPEMEMLAFLVVVVVVVDLGLYIEDAKAFLEDAPL